MDQENKQSAVERLASTISRVSTKAIQKQIEDTMTLRPFLITERPIHLKKRLHECVPDSVEKFKLALSKYISADLSKNYDQKQSARLELEKASYCLLPKDAPKEEVPRRVELLVDHIQDAIFAAEFSYAKIKSLRLR